MTLHFVSAITFSQHDYSVPASSVLSTVSLISGDGTVLFRNTQYHPVAIYLIQCQVIITSIFGCCGWHWHCMGVDFNQTGCQWTTETRHLAISSMSPRCDENKRLLLVGSGSGYNTDSHQPPFLR